MSGYRLGDFIEGLSARGAAEVENCEAVWRCPGLQKALLQGLSERMHAILTLAKVAQPVAV